MVKVFIRVIITNEKNKSIRLYRYNSGGCKKSPFPTDLLSKRIMTSELIEVVKKCAESLRDNNPLLICG